MAHESEHITRKTRIDKALQHSGWIIINYRDVTDYSLLSNNAVEEYETENGPADYALFVKGKLLGVVEAKKVDIGPQNVLEQAKRYSQGVPDTIGKWKDFRINKLNKDGSIKMFKPLNRELLDKNWGIFLSNYFEFLINITEKNKLIGEYLIVENPFTKSDAYKLKEILINCKYDDQLYKFINTGTIEPYCNLWGKVETRYLRKTYLNPCVKKISF